ncbi:MAG: hypothetical protein LC105_06275 [Chitinophagales bacterium]|nr:hypothetical protein [Chitinophagales bacterium]
MKKVTFIKLFFLILLLIGQLCYANMASPLRKGTMTASAFSSHDIDILNEKIFLKTDNKFETAFFRIDYFIRSNTSGIQIPLLFYAKDFKGDFKIWVDKQPVHLLDIPNEYIVSKESPLEKFSNSLDTPTQNLDAGTVEIFWEKKHGYIYSLKDLKYFETNLTQGNHHIRVEYVANVWKDISGWVKEYSFRYSLSPAKKWKSFGSLEITLDASDFNSKLSTTLGQQDSGQLNNIATWSFSKLPDEYFEVIYKPEISALAKFLIRLSPFGLTLIFSLLTLLFHFLSIRKYRLKFPEKKNPWVLNAGSIVLPFIILIFYIYSFTIIDNSIGNEAGKYHGYTFLVVLLYPIIMPIYWLFVWLLDKIFVFFISKEVAR